VTAGELVARLEGVRPTRRGWIGRCPAHSDGRPSLAIAEGAGGRVLLHDYGGCRAEEILGVLGLDFGALFPEGRPPRRPQHRSPLEEARARILAAARRQAWARPGVLEGYRRADLLRSMDRVVDAARQAATTLGPDDPRAWDLLEAAAGLERIVLLEDGEPGA
jgi:hypothetical protein